MNESNSKDSETIEVLNNIICGSIVDLFKPIIKTGELSNSPEDEVLFIRVLIDKAVQTDPNSKNHFDSYLKYLNYILTKDYNDIEEVVDNYQKEYPNAEF